MRENRATVRDESLGKAFAEGVNEGFRLTGYVLLVIRVGNKDIVHDTVKASEIPTLVADRLESLRGEHYEVGVTIRIIADGDVKTESDKAQAHKVEDPAIGESGIEDAEVVDG